MKKLIIVGLITLVFVGCQQGPARYSSTSPEIDAIKAHIKDYNAGEWDAWADRYADTAKIYHNSLKAATVAETQEGLAGLLAAASSYGFVDKDMFHEMVVDDKNEKWVNFWATWEGTLAANSKKLVIPVHVTFQFDGGKIVEEHAYYNLAEYAAAMQEIEAAKMAEEEAEEE